MIPTIGQQFVIDASIRKKKKKNLIWITTNLDNYPTLSVLPPAIINDICFNFPMLYTFIRFIHYDKRIQIQEDQSFEVFLRELSKEYIYNILKFLDPRLDSLNLTRLNKKEMFIMLGDHIQKKCCLENFFIQDLFHPGIIFKESYKYDSSYMELFGTAFYYILNCEFPSKDFPLKLIHKRSNFKFPIDVDPIEFERPCILIDVANQFNKDKHPNFSRYSYRIQYLQKNITQILENICERHVEPNLMIFFINQGDRSKNFNCPEIIDVVQWVNNNALRILLNGTVSDPKDRKALYISVPCHLFLSPQPDYPNQTRIVDRDFYFNMGNEPGYPGGGGYYQRVKLKKTDPPIRYREEVKNIVYDRYGRLMFLPDINIGHKTNRHTFRTVYGDIYNDRSEIPYYSYMPVDDPRRHPTLPPFRRDPGTMSHTKRHPDGKTFQGKNEFEHFVRPVNECSGHTIHKNEIDDYMIGMLCLLHYKISKECNNYSPYRAKWMLFTHDQYRWMNPKILVPEFFVRHDDLLSYIQSPNIKRKKYNLLIRNPEATKIITDVGLYPYRYNDQRYLNLLDGIIRINRKIR